MNNLDEFDPFRQESMQFLDNGKIAPTNSRSIVEPLKEQVSSLHRNFYENYQHINEAWHTPGHGIDIKNQKELSSFLNDIEKSKDIWQKSGIYLGCILQAVHKDNIIDRGSPIGLYQDLNNYEEDKINHITSSEIKDIIEMYKEYLCSEVIKDISDVFIEVKPFYAINEQKINYEVVEQNCNKKLKIK